MIPNTLAESSGVDGSALFYWIFILSSFLSYFFYPLSLTFYPISHPLSYLFSLISHLLSLVSYLLSYFSSLISNLLSLISYLFFAVKVTEGEPKPTAMETVKQRCCVHRQ